MKYLRRQLSDWLMIFGYILNRIAQTFCAHDFRKITQHGFHLIECKHCKTNARAKSR